MNQSGRKSSLLVNTVVWSCVVHAIFVYRALLAVPGKGLIYSEWDLAVFFPHATLMYSLPPGYPFNEIIVSNWKIAGKLAGAFPASFLYGGAIALLVNWLLLKYRATEGKP